MINIIVPLAGTQTFFPEGDYPYPKPLVEINGRTMIELMLENFSKIQRKKKYTFIVNLADCKRFHFDNTLQLLTNHESTIIKIDKETKGAACSTLLAVDAIDLDSPLIISNSDQVFDLDLNEIVEKFVGCDAGVVTFDSVHPRWSYAQVDASGMVTETAEKNPISKHAIAGFYYFSRARDYIDGVCRMIAKDAVVNGDFFIAPVMNELVLANKKIKAVSIDGKAYHSFYSPAKISEYERTFPASYNG